MRAIVPGGILGKAVYALWHLHGLRVPLYAANACYFLVLSVFPALILLLGLLRYTPLDAGMLVQLLRGVLPEALLEPARELIALTWNNTSGVTLGLSAVTALWSASRGVRGMLTGLNRVYGVQQVRGFFRIRLAGVGYTAAFLILLALSLDVFRRQGDFLRAGLPAVLTLFFCTVFTWLPGRKGRFRRQLPGALLAGVGWLLFSRLYSVYAAYCAHMASVYGSVYALALSMLWLYCCVCLVLYGGAVNAMLENFREKP